MTQPEATALLAKLHADATVNRSHLSPELQTLIATAKSVVVLSEWKKTRSGEEVFSTTWIGIQALKEAINAAENPPLLQLAPEGTAPGKL
jgi:hypothetical protein